MKITIEKKPQNDLLDVFDPVELENYNLHCCLCTSEEACSSDIVKMIYKAMIIEGYLPKSIQQSLLDVALFEAYESNTKLDLDYSLKEVFNLKDE